MCQHRLWDKTPSSPNIPVAKPEVPTASVAPPAPTTPPDPIRPKIAGPRSPTSPGVPQESPWTQPGLIGCFILILAGLAVSRQSGGALFALGFYPFIFICLFITYAERKFENRTEPKTLLEKITHYTTVVASAILIIMLAALGLLLALGVVCAFILFSAKN